MNRTVWGGPGEDQQLSMGPIDDAQERRAAPRPGRTAHAAGRGQRVAGQVHDQVDGPAGAVEYLDAAVWSERGDDGGGDVPPGLEVQVRCAGPSGPGRPQSISRRPAGTAAPRPCSGG